VHSFRDSALTILVLMYVVLWIVGSITQYRVLRALRRMNISDLGLGTSAIAPVLTRQFRWFLLRREYLTRPEIPPELQKRCERLRTIRLALVLILVLMLVTIVGARLWP
jgi:hypothetical protein